MNPTMTSAVKASSPAVVGGDLLSITSQEWEILPPHNRKSSPALKLAAKKPAKGSKTKTSGTKTTGKKKKSGPGRLKDGPGGGGNGPH
jgi:hypothetical protein